MRYNLNRIMTKGSVKNTLDKYIHTIVDVENGRPVKKVITLEVTDDHLPSMRNAIHSLHTELRRSEVMLLECSYDDEYGMNVYRDSNRKALQAFERACNEYYRVCGWVEHNEAETIRAEDVRNKYTARDITERYGYTITRSKIKCINPLHEDSSPSMHVYEYSVYCFSCTKHYDTISIVEILEGCTFKESLKILSN